MCSNINLWFLKFMSWEWLLVCLCVLINLPPQLSICNTSHRHNSFHRLICWRLWWAVKTAYGCLISAWLEMCLKAVITVWMFFSLSPERMLPHQHSHPCLVDENSPFLYTNCNTQIYYPPSLSLSILTSVFFGVPSLDGLIFAFLVSDVSPKQGREPWFCYPRRKRWTQWPLVIHSHH